MCIDIPEDGVVDIWWGKIRSRQVAEYIGIDLGMEAELGSKPYLQYVLAHYLDVAPKQIQLRRDMHGRLLMEDQAPKVGFCASHSQNTIWIAIARQSVGLDVEREDTNIQYMGVAKRWLHPNEANRIEAVIGDKQVQDFFQAWTLRESYLKLIGTGFYGNFRESEIVQDEMGGEWSGGVFMRHARLDDGFHLAVASESQIGKIRLVRNWNNGASLQAREIEAVSSELTKNGNPNFTSWRNLK